MPDIAGRHLGVVEGLWEFLKSPFVWGIGAGLLLSWVYITGIGKKGLMTMAGLAEREAERLIERIEAK